MRQIKQESQDPRLALQLVSLEFLIAIGENIENPLKEFKHST